MKHNELCQRAGKWLANSCSMQVILVEPSWWYMYGDTEIPDAIGFSGTKSILVEAKTSRSDYYADKNKPFRIHPEMGLGEWRFFFIPKNSFMPKSVPDGWGLYEVGNRVVRHKMGVKYIPGQRGPFKSNIKAERGLLVSSLSNNHRWKNETTNK